MNKRKFFGTIIGVIFWSICVVYFTYAYYEWKSINTEVVLGIQDLATQCNKGPNVNVSNIGPIFYPSDGVKVKFSLTNDLMTTQNFSIQLNITSISDNLLVDDFKWILIKEEDYDVPIVEGDFSNFQVGTNTIANILPLESNTSNLYQFIVYIDGNMYNDPNIQNNSLNSYLEIGNCGIIKEPTLMNTSSTNDFRNEAYITNIKTASFVDYIDTTNASLDMNNNPIQWDMSTVQDNGVIAWLEPNTEEGYYDLYIGANDTIYANSLENFFYGMTGLTNINFDNLDTSFTVDMTFLFRDCNSLINLDLSNFDTNNVTKMYYMFYNCSSIISLNLSNFDTSKVTNMSGMFAGCNSLNSVNLNGLDTGNTTNMGSMFLNCYDLVELDLSSFDTSKVIIMSNMFYDCDSLSILELSNFIIDNVTTMESMFENCSSLTRLDLSSFASNKVTSTKNMFKNCNSLSILELSNFLVDNVTTMESMFENCSSLDSLDLSSFASNKVTSTKYMFYNCSGLSTLDMCNFNTSSVTTMLFMFRNCSNLSILNISSFDTSSVTDMYFMFDNCVKLTTSFTIMNSNINVFDGIFRGAATSEGAVITVNYTSNTSTLVDNMIATKSTNSNVIKGSLVS